jgi:TPR repeat protein
MLGHMTVSPEKSNTMRVEQLTRSLDTEPLQSVVTPLYRLYTRSFIFALFSLHSANYVYSSQDLVTIQQMVEQGNLDAQFSLGVRYTKGEGIVQDSEQVVAWFRKAAEVDHASAQYNLGRRHEFRKPFI